MIDSVHFFFRTRQKSYKTNVSQDEDEDDDDKPLINLRKRKASALTNVGLFCLGYSETTNL